MSKINPHLAYRLSEIQPFYVMDVLTQTRRLEAEGRAIIHMEIGEPDFTTPQPIVEAGIRALRAGLTHYTPAIGLPALRECISDFYHKQYLIDVPPERIVITPGASGALQLLMGVLINPSEKVLMADPGYPCNRHFVRLAEGKAIAVPVDYRSNYQITESHLEAYWSPDTVALLLASPSNPAGTLIPPEKIQKIIEKVHQLGGSVIIDEIYHGLVYEGEVKTALSFSDEVFVINSFSKYFGMTGWRLGWLVAPHSYVRHIEKLAQNIFIAPPTVAQYAALAAFKDETLYLLELRRQEFQKRLHFLLPKLKEIGFHIPVAPQGAFYIYADAGRFTSDSHQFAKDLLMKAGVAVTPGNDFGKHKANRHVRFSCTTTMDKLGEGVRRLNEALIHDNPTR